MDIDDEIAQVNEALREFGVTLEELIESGREIRGELLREMYGIDPDAEHDHASTSLDEKDQWNDQ